MEQRVLRGQDSDRLESSDPLEAAKVARSAVLRYVSDSDESTIGECPIGGLGIPDSDAKKEGESQAGTSPLSYLFVRLRETNHAGDGQGPEGRSRVVRIIPIMGLKFPNGIWC